MPTPRVIRYVPESDVIAHWAALYTRGHHAGYKAPWRGQHAGKSAVWVEVAIPHALYDADWNTEDARLSDEQRARAEAYAKLPGQLPPGMALFSGRRGRTRAFVSDGNHRALASYLRGNATARFYMPLPDWERFARIHTPARTT